MKKQKQTQPSIHDDRLSFKQLFKFYSKVNIPWFFLILNMAFSILVKEAETWLVPYTTNIQMGAITGAGFLLNYIGVFLLYETIVTLQESMNDYGRIRCARNVSRKVWEKMLKLPMSFYKDDNQRLVSRVTQDTTGAYGAVNVALQLFSVLYGVYTNFRRMYLVYKELALIMLAFIPLTFIVAWIVGKMQYKVSYIINNSISIITNFFGERLPNIMHIKTTNMEDEEYRRGLEASDARYKSEVKQENIFIFMGPLSSMPHYINQIIILVIASELVRQGVMKQYQMLNLYNYFLLFMGNAMMISGLWQAFKNSHGSCVTIAKIMDAQEEDMVSGSPVPEGSQEIAFQNVRFSYDGSRDILKDVSFTIPAGKRTVIVGENGSGKSTIIKLLERFENQTSGTIRLGDTALSDVNLESWRNSVGYLFQGDQIIKGSIRENITYGLDREYTDAELEQAMRLAHAWDFVADKEEGLDTQISRFDAKVSGGEMQRIAIARMILKNPQYLIMDEATSSIDTVTTEIVLDSLYGMMEGKTIIMIAHDMDIIRSADHVIVLADGQVETSGSFETVSQESSIIRNFLLAEAAV